MRAIAAATLALLAASCGPGVPPCTTCIDVQGTYEVTVDERSADGSTCGLLHIAGSTADVELYQTGSKLELPLFFGSAGGLEGTLMEDERARFGPLKVLIANTDPATYAHVTVSGAFTGDEASRRFGGSMVVSAFLADQTCSISTRVRMTRKAAGH